MITPRRSPCGSEMPPSRFSTMTNSHIILFGSDSLFVFSCLFLAYFSATTCPVFHLLVGADTYKALVGIGAYTSSVPPQSFRSTFSRPLPHTLKVVDVARSPRRLENPLSFVTPFVELVRLQYYPPSLSRFIYLSLS